MSQEAVEARFADLFDADVSAPVSLPDVDASAAAHAEEAPPAASPAEPKADARTPAPAEKAVQALSPAAAKPRKPANGAKRKRAEEADKQHEEAEKKARSIGAAEDLQKAILDAAPSAPKILEILKAEPNLANLANAITRIAMSANSFTRETDARVRQLWPSIEKQLQAQMAFSKNLRGGHCQKQLKLEVPMVPAEAPRQWLKEYDADGRIMLNPKGKKLVTDSVSQLKFTADVPLGKGIGWGYSSGMLSVSSGLSFTYCKVTRTLVITGKYGLGM